MTRTNTQPHVLYAEDDPQTRESVARVLERSGYCVTVAKNGRELFDTLKSEALGSYDCIVTDHNMPEMSGLEVLRAIRDDEERADIPVLIYSAASHAIRERAEELNATVLSKHEATASNVAHTLDRMLIA